MDKEEPPKRKLGKVERGRAACNECRRHKIRCLPHPEDPDHQFPCSRCERMNLGCEFTKHNRGRKRKRPTDAGTEAASPEAPEAGPSKNRPQPRPYDYQSSERTEEFSKSFGDPRFPFISTDLADTVPSKGYSSTQYESEHRNYGARQPMSLKHMIGEDYENELSSDEDEEDSRYADEDEENREDQGTRRRAKAAINGGGYSAPDPVKAGVVSEEEAKALFRLFMAHHNNSMPMLDPAVHTHDYIRNVSTLLYTAILCVTSRYLPSITSNKHEVSPESARSVHQQILVSARDNLTWIFAEAIIDINAVRAMIVLALYKEPDDDKAGYYINRAVLMGKELNLGRIPPKEELDRMNEDQQRCVRSRQRVWLCLFFVNSIFAMQFRQPMLILQNDHLVASAHHWLKRSMPETLLRDTQLVCSVELRRKYLHYRDLLLGTGPEGTAYRSALSLSILTRSMNEDWDVISNAWIRDIIDVGGTSSHVIKPRIWSSALCLNLNLLLVNQTLRLPPDDQIDYGTPSSIPAFHHCLNAATTVLMRFEALDRQQLTFASDTFLHFALYAATLLSSLCRGQHPYKFDSLEIEHCRRLITKAADALDSASHYTHDSPQLHSFYLRRLLQYLPPPPPVPTSGSQQSSSPRFTILPGMASLPGMGEEGSQVGAMADLAAVAGTGVGVGMDMDMFMSDFAWMGDLGGGTDGNLALGLAGSLGGSLPQMQVAGAPLYGSSFGRV
ncbi:hypothetical protein L202_04853 [Cryptococcus amylolentus CBS 6039]|uniref:Zn(2)-C6 fungal-type domain-containing protein n=2 Tax=Cryptococcus amylolentus TaxID=104669 RepID=A0A1E3HMY2_9TREE|nr:hypothetical protein L202_04853 [Cryptococcus amylolentus CBS 6039]ODN77710.1 hypothetical protein L202_04853 [Cryptococcus amylolentus CBS 6039]ODO05718.1 hypothetical protein I350_04778 [Cryptococcus amylolentus CBS 6273]